MTILTHQQLNDIAADNGRNWDTDLPRLIKSHREALTMIATLVTALEDMIAYATCTCGDKFCARCGDVEQANAALRAAKGES